MSIDNIFRSGIFTLGLVAMLSGCGGKSADDVFSCPRGTQQTAKRSSDSIISYCTQPNGTEHGPVEGRYFDGTLALKGRYVKGKKEGEWIQWDENGTISLRGTYDDSVREGLWTHWFRGMKIVEQEYHHGLPEGIFTVWKTEGREMGQLDMQGQCKNGYINGVVNYLQTTQVETYKDGVMVDCEGSFTCKSDIIDQNKKAPEKCKDYF